jgi:hypothetical protein
MVGVDIIALLIELGFYSSVKVGCGGGWGGGGGLGLSKFEDESRQSRELGCQAVGILPGQGLAGKILR